jgi:hypothetical protein
MPTDTIEVGHEIPVYITIVAYDFSASYCSSPDVLHGVALSKAVRCMSSAPCCAAAAALIAYKSEKMLITVAICQALVPC